MMSPSAYATKHTAQAGAFSSSSSSQLLLLLLLLLSPLLVPVEVRFEVLLSVALLETMEGGSETEAVMSLLPSLLS